MALLCGGGGGEVGVVAVDGVVIDVGGQSPRMTVIDTVKSFRRLDAQRHRLGGYIWRPLSGVPFSISPSLIVSGLLHRCLTHMNRHRTSKRLDELMYLPSRLVTPIQLPLPVNVSVHTTHNYSVDI